MKGGDEPRWVTKQGLIALHDRSLALHGGAPGLRDEGLLESALSRPINRHVYEGATDIVDLAATYAAALCANHPFVDGNKRAALLAAGLFLEKNGFHLKASPTEAAVMMFQVAAGKIEAEALARRIRLHLGT